ncbi:MAG: hypothetical protein PHS07_00725 [Patescibacteria group bacterium]|jgi:hypothetical protein|nr:hypothetical protein [Patescibacteria group bacterium]
MNPKKIEVMFEFLIFGIVVGVIEDLLAVKLVTGETIDCRAIWIVVVIAIPFAVIGEIFADKIDFVKLYNKIFKKK